MERIEGSGRCETCGRRRIVFLWTRDTKENGRWVVTQAVKACSVEYALKICQCEGE